MTNDARGKPSWLGSLDMLKEQVLSLLPGLLPSGMKLDWSKNCCSGCRLLASAQALSASEQSQKHLQQDLAACKAAVQDAVDRADAAHLEALSYLSKMRQQDRQAEIDRLAMCYKNLSVDESCMTC